MLCAFKLNEYFYSVVKPYCRKKANSLKKKIHAIIQVWQRI